MSRPSAQLRRDRDEPVDLALLGQVGYLDAFALQRELVAERQTGRGRDTLLLLEHPPVYTLGKRASADNVLLTPAQLDARGIEVVEVDRGGDVTYHGPGQLVGYPIIALAGVRSVVDYVRALEQVLITALARLGVDAQRVPDSTGVWVGEEKVAAIGVRVASGGITSHGFALNVAPALRDFAGIVPCGITDRGVCSLESLGVTDDLTEVTELVTGAFAEVFAATLDPIAPAALPWAASPVTAPTDDR